jgi:AAA family ATPase
MAELQAPCRRKFSETDAQGSGLGSNLFSAKNTPDQHDNSQQQNYIMSTNQEPQKTLEVKIRPFSNQNNQERPDQKGASRVHLCSEALRELSLGAGQICYLWKVNETPERRREAIVWPTLEKSLSKKVVQMSKTFQEATGFKLADDLKICAAESPNVKIAETIVLRDLTGEEASTIPELVGEEKQHWEWFLKESLGKSKWEGVWRLGFVHS